MELELLLRWKSINLGSTSLIWWRRQWQPTPVLLPGESHGQRSLVGCSPWSCYELDTTERLHFHFSLSCIGEGNGNPLQCSCLENPRDEGAWWAAIHGVTQSRTWLKRHSSSSLIQSNIPRNWVSPKESIPKPKINFMKIWRKWSFSPRKLFFFFHED